MKIIGISGSPRRESSASYLVESIVNTAIANGNEGEMFILRHLNIEQCHACSYCAKGKGCKLDDDMIAMYEKIYDCDLLVVGSPVYFGEVSAQTKTFIDRFYQFYKNPNRDIKNKKIIQVFTQGQDDEDKYKAYFDYQKQFTYNIVGFEVIDRLIASGINSKEDLLDRNDLLEKAMAIGKNI